MCFRHVFACVRRESLFFLLCPRPTVALCTHPSPSAAAFCDTQEYPLPPITPDLKPKMEGQGRLGTVAARGPRRLLCREAEGLRPLGLVPASPAAGREGIKLRAALRFPGVAPCKPSWAGVRRGGFLSKCSIESGPGPFSRPAHSSPGSASWRVGPASLAQRSLPHTQYLSQGPRHRT